MFEFFKNLFDYVIPSKEDDITKVEIAKVEVKAKEVMVETKVPKKRGRKPKQKTEGA